MKLANQKELDEASYNDYQLATERARRKIEMYRDIRERTTENLINSPFATN